MQVAEKVSRVPSIAITHFGPVDVAPDKVDLLLQTAPSGLNVFVDGLPFAARKCLRHFDTSAAAFSWQLDYASNTALLQVRLFIRSIRADIGGILMQRCWKVCAGGSN